LSKINLNNISV